MDRWPAYTLEGAADLTPREILALLEYDKVSNKRVASEEYIQPWTR